MALVLALGVIAAACSSSTPEEATTIVQDTADEQVAAMCRTLELLNSVGAPAGKAAEAITATDLDGPTTPEMSAYGELLVRAPIQECPDQIDYADDVAYWLGF